ncbi:MAG: hypothetical protein K2J83_05735, partial [Clostridia bacterium]|nr:hypothetical protein [Clostridia bacterium]
LYSTFSKSQNQVYAMTYQASFICEFAAEYQTIAADYDLFCGIKEFDAKLDFANVSEDYLANLKEVCSLTEISRKLYDYTEGETIYFDSNVSDIEKVMESLSKANAIAESYHANTSNLPGEWDSDSRIINMLFTIVLAIDGTIIVAFWIGEVFKDRAKCIKDNNEKIKSILQ